MGAKLIAYECVAAGHQPTALHPDKLTVHEREWAFCPFDARASDHDWRATGGVALDILTRRHGLTTAPAAPASKAPAETAPRRNASRAE